MGGTDTPAADHSTTGSARHDASPNESQGNQKDPTSPESEYLPCRRHKTKGRNLVVCIDGTAQKLGKKSTNVIELFKLLMKDGGNDQLCWYTSGMGTYARPRWKSPKYYLSVLDHKIDSTIAWDIERLVLEAYQWLAENYQEDDCIFLFGFSRGAFQARGLSAMIAKVGLVYKGNISQIPYAYEHYVRAGLGGKHQDIAQAFKESFSRQGVHVHFVGAWDTVSSVGTGRGHRALPGTIDGMAHVCYFRHALALDERRVMFQPEYAYGGTTTPIGPEPPRGTSYVAHPEVLEVWFPGTHSDIGSGPAPRLSNAVGGPGGHQGSDGKDPEGNGERSKGRKHESDDTSRSRPPLRWMATHAAELGLRIKGFTLADDGPEIPCQHRFRDSLSGFWYIFELIPLNRLTFSRTKRRGIGTTRIPHLGAGRKIHQGQKIHFSFTFDEGYVPKARAGDVGGSFWKDLRSQTHPDSVLLLERDMFYLAADAVKAMLRGVEFERLAEVVADKMGSQFLYDKVIEKLRKWSLKEPKPDQDDTRRLLQNMLDIFSSKAENIKLREWVQIRAFLSELLNVKADQDRETVRKFESQFSEDVYCLFKLEHGDWVQSIVISPDGLRIASGDSKGIIHMWDTKLRERVGRPLVGHAKAVYSMAFLPDGSRLVSGSLDETIRIWSTDTGEQVGVLNCRNMGSVQSVAVSPDGERIVSSSFDGTIRIWNVKTMEEGQVRVDTGAVQSTRASPVRSVRLSADGKRIVSAHQDGHIRMWDLNTGAQKGELQTDADQVFAIAISPDGKYIVSGSNVKDRAIRIWDAMEGTLVGRPLSHVHGQGNIKVNSIAISPDSRHVVSGFDDHTIQIWFLETGKLVGELRGHTNAVTSVRVSLDGKQIISGSDDKTVRIWDAEEILIPKQE